MNPLDKTLSGITIYPLAVASMLAALVVAPILLWMDSGSQLGSVFLIAGIVGLIVSLVAGGLGEPI